MNGRLVIYRHKFYLCALLYGLFILSSCTDYQSVAPVQDVTTERQGNYLIHRVESGETLYAIAWRYERDYLDLAHINQLKPPYAIHPGQMIYLNQSPYVQKYAKKQISHHPQHQEKTIIPRNWIFPAKGKIIHGFSSRNKGIDIAGSYGAPVCATEGGKVVYAGNGIRGYGNLLIIKHGENFLTAYAYNKTLLVIENQNVRKGQQVATMGKSNSGAVLLHFEVRFKGKPVNPTHYVGIV